MDTRTIGSLTVSLVGLGCNNFGGRIDEAQTRAVVDAAREAGITLFDTADIYGPEDNERLVGSALAPHRDRVEIATKFGARSLEDEGRAPDGRPDYAGRACDASLRRLGVDSIDLYYLHRVDPQVPIEETVGAMGELVTAGKVRYLGLSEAAPETLRRAHATHPISALQSELSLWTRDVEAEVLPTCEELGIGFVAYSPLGRGFLTGAITSPEDLDADDWRRGNPRFQGGAFDANLRLVDAIREMADARGVTAAQLALAWVRTRGDHVVPIPGTTKPERVEENLAALDVELKADELERLDEIAPIGVATGDRYPQGAMELVHR